MWKAIKRDFWLGIFSLIISISLWLHVQLSKPQLAQELFSFEVKIVNFDRSKLALSRMSADVVRIRASGEPEELKKVKGKTFSAYVDLLDAEPGLKEYRLQPDYPTGVNLEWERPPTVFVNLEPLAHDFRKVTAVLDDSLAPSGFTLGDPTVEPEMIKIEGPQSRIDMVVTVRAMVLSPERFKPGMRFSAPLEFLDKNNKVVSGVAADVNEVTVIPTLLALTPRHSLLVTPQWRGQPAFGYRVASITVTPNQIEVTGDDRKLSRLSTVSTQPIDLTGLTSSRTFQAKLELPSGAQAKSTKPITVRVIIEKEPVTPVTPPSPGQ